jgi:biotin transport system substrate-specific component
MQGGFGVLFGPTGGFIFSFIIMAFLISKMKNVKIINNEKIDLFIILLIANLVVYMIGGTYLGIYLNLSIGSTLAVLVPFLIGDSLKIMVSIYAYMNIRSHVTYEGPQI